MIDTPLYSAAERVMRSKGIDLDSWLVFQVEDGRSSQEIADRLSRETDEIVQVSREAIRRWTKQLQKDAA